MGGSNSRVDLDSGHRKLADDAKYSANTKLICSVVQLDVKTTDAAALIHTSIINALQKNPNPKKEEVYSVLQKHKLLPVKVSVFSFHATDRIVRVDKKSVRSQHKVVNDAGVPKLLTNSKVNSKQEIEITSPGLYRVSSTRGKTSDKPPLLSYDVQPGKSLDGVLIVPTRKKFASCNDNLSLLRTKNPELAIVYVDCPYFWLIHFSAHENDIC